MVDTELPDEQARPAGAVPNALPSGLIPKDKNVQIASEFLKKTNPSEFNKIPKLKDEVDALEQIVLSQDDYPTIRDEPTGPNGETQGQLNINNLAKKKTELSGLIGKKDMYETFKGMVSNTGYTYEIGPIQPPSPVPSSVFKKGTSRPLQKAKPSAQPSPQAQPAPRAVNSNPAVKSDDEKIAEEYGMLTSRLQGLGGVPMNWSEDTYRQMRGYAPKIKIVQQGGIALIGIGDKWQVLKTGAENQMSPSELATTEKHAVWKDSIRTDRLSNAKWTFRGDIRTTEADTAGKVKKAVTDSTRALEALDKLIDLGETGFWDSITPSDKAGVIEGVTNSVQAAGRTEIAGSGAFSEQDAKKLESIVPSMASVSGAVFREKSLTMLKTYRERMAMQVGDIGRTWGFEVKETKNAGLTEPQIAAIRGAYTDLIKQGYNHEDAKKLAIESLNQ